MVPPQQAQSLSPNQPIWLLLAIASGACAAFNGVFAKLTTTDLTTTLAMHLTHLFSTTPSETFSTLTNYTLRALFFALNLVFNLAMWSLFTTALTRATSTTRVSIVNTSANFFVTAVLGALVFGEKLPGMWWVGAALLAAGTVVVGAKVRRDGEGQKGKGRGEEGEGLMGMTGEEEEEGDMIDMDDGLGSGGGGGFADGETTRDAVRMGEEVDAPLR